MQRYILLSTQSIIDIELGIFFIFTVNVCFSFQNRDNPAWLDFPDNFE